MFKKEEFNKSSLILGSAGTGKTYMIKKEIIELSKDKDIRILVIDPNNEYEKLRKALNGITFNIGTTSLENVNFNNPDKVPVFDMPLNKNLVIYNTNSGGMENQINAYLYALICVKNEIVRYKNYNRKGTTYVYFEDIQSVFNDELGLVYLKSLFKVSVKKLSAAFIFIGQSANDFFKNEHTTCISQNCHYIYLYSTSKDDIEILKAQYKITDEEANLIYGKPCGCGLKIQNTSEEPKRKKEPFQITKDEELDKIENNE